MTTPLHITSGDIAGGNLAKAGLPGEIFVWHDILYDGPRRAVGGLGRPDEETLEARALFLEETTGGGLDRGHVLETLRHQYQKLAQAGAYERIVLWFDACLFDQSMLAHILTCLAREGVTEADLLCVDAFPGIEPFHGLGQLQPEQLASLRADRRPVTKEQFEFAAVVDEAFAVQDAALLTELSEMTAAPLRWVPARGGAMVAGTAGPGDRPGTARKPRSGSDPGRVRNPGQYLRLGGRRRYAAAILGRYDAVGQNQRAGGPSAPACPDRGPGGRAAPMGEPSAAGRIQDQTGSHA